MDLEYFMQGDVFMDLEYFMGADILHRAPTFYIGRRHFDVNYYFVYCRQTPTFNQFMILQSVLPVYFAISFA